MARSFLYLVAIIDWYSHYVVDWRLSNTLEAYFCAEALWEALSKGTPEVFNTDQGEPVHRRGLHRAPRAPRNQNQHGWKRQV